MKQLSRFALQLGAVAAACGCMSTAVAQTSPYYIGINQRFTHESNVLQSSAGAVSDTQSSTSIIAGLDQPIGRQRLFGNLSASTNRYQDNSQLNHSAYAARLGLDWSTIGRISGNLAVDASQSLASYNPAGLTPGVITGDNTTRTQGLTAVARMGVVTRMTGEVMLSTRSTRFSNAGYALRESDINEGSIGLKYRPGGFVDFGAALRLTRGKYPRYLPTPDRFDAKNLDLTAGWSVSGASTLNARVSLGRTSYDYATERDFSGATGSLGWTWKPTAKVSLNTTLSRAAGDQSQLQVGQDGVLTSTSVNRVTNTLALGATYEVTAKIGVRAGVSYSDATVINPVSKLSGSEKSDTLSLGVAWAATRSIRTGCDFGRTSRSASALATAYDSNSFGCFGEITLR